MTVSETASSGQGQGEEVIDVHQTACCVVGGGPGGMMLALLLARRGVPVTLLEAHPMFERDFRGDTIHPGLMEILDEIGLADRLHERQHVRMYGPTLPGSKDLVFDLRRLVKKTRFQPLKSGSLCLRDLAEVQRRREWPTRVIQALGAVVLGQLGRQLRSGSRLGVPRFVRLLFGLPLLGKLIARLFAFGLWRVHVKN